MKEKNLLPLVVDLDGTLINTDMLHESSIMIARDSPLHAIRAVSIANRGRALLKQCFAQKIEVNPKTLPYNYELIVWLKKQKALGRKLVLCTASDKVIANAIAAHLELFDEVIASDGKLNIKKQIKAQILSKRFGLKGYDYVGNSHDDIPVWANANKVILVNPSKNLVRKITQLFSIEKIFRRNPITFSQCFALIRMHQWVKNLLIFIPILVGQDLGNGSSWLTLLFAFLAFSLCASSIYIINDLFDLQSDRLHPIKKNRPMAAGQIPIWVGCSVAPILLLISLVFGAMIGTKFLICLVGYFFLTSIYSWFLKQIILIDCLILTTLYSVRVLAGTLAVEHDYSFWLMIFSMFIFLSLAFLKRVNELRAAPPNAQMTLAGRGYIASDLQLIQIMGIVSGYVAVLVLALYINSEEMKISYRYTELIWFTLFVVLFWINWIWLQMNRSTVDCDPVLFVLKDKISISAGIIILLIISVNYFGSIWP